MKTRRIAIFILVLLIVGLGMLPTIVGWMATPPDRGFIGTHGYSSDYIQYVSYIKEGMYGRYTMLFRSFPFPQPKTPIHFLYIAIGAVAKVVFISSAPVAYHLSRIILGALFVFICFRFFLLRFPKLTEAFFVTLLAFVSSPFYTISSSTGGKWALTPIQFFNFFIGADGRASDRPHYTFGAIGFLLLILLLYRTEHQKRSSRVFLVLLVIVSFTMTMAHASSGIIALCVYVAWLTVDRGKILQKLTIIFGVAGALALSYWSIRQYRLVPEIWLDFYAYAGSLTPVSLYQDFLSFGPTLLLAFIGLLLRLKKRHPLDMFVFVWLVVQMGLFMYGYRWFHADRVRFLQSLYFIPFAYGTAMLIKTVSMRLRKPLFLILTGIVILYSIPPYVSNLVNTMFLSTNYREFSVFEFPTRKQWEAYEYLDRKTRVESIVLAGYEAANHILIASHNQVIGNNQGWGVVSGQEMYMKRDYFLSGTMKEHEARKYLSDNHIEYVYYGYQEKSFGDVKGYSFLTPVFSNPEVTIYRFPLFVPR